MKIRMHLTELAEAMAKKHSSVETVKVKAQDEIQQIVNDGMKNPYDDLILHTFESGDQEYIITPAADENGKLLVVNTCSREEGPTLDKGPFAGMKLSLPSED